MTSQEKKRNKESESESERQVGGGGGELPRESNGTEPDRPESTQIEPRQTLFYHITKRKQQQQRQAPWAVDDRQTDRQMNKTKHKVSGAWESYEYT